MIKHIEIRNFRSIRAVAIDLEPLTVLIGCSGVGKSNFLQAIRFGLAWSEVRESLARNGVVM